MTYPKANRTAQWFYDDLGGSPYPAVEKVVWHTTEGSGWPAYDGGRKAPHYTVRPDFSARTMVWRAHFPDLVNSRALQNDAGGVETNRDGALQVEIVGTCDQTRTWPAGILRSWVLEPWMVEGLADFAAWAKRAHGVPLVSPLTWLAYSNATGVARENNGIRMSGAAWNRFRGHCGHQHVPENDHGDPGALPMPRILSRAAALITPPKQEDVMASLDEVVKGVLGARVPSWLDEDGNPKTDDTVPLGTAVGAARTDSRLARDNARAALEAANRVEDKVDQLLALLNTAAPTRQ